MKYLKTILLFSTLFTLSHTRFGMTWLEDPFQEIKRIQQEQEEKLQNLRGFTDQSQSVSYQFNIENNELQIGLPLEIEEKDIKTHINRNQAQITIESNGLACSIIITERAYKVEANMQHKDNSSSSKGHTSYYSTLQYAVDLDNIEIVLDKEKTNVLSIILPPKETSEGGEIRIRLK